MAQIAAGEFTAMQADAEHTLNDIGKVGTRSGNDWDTDPGEDTFTYGAAIACGVGMVSLEETTDGSQAPLGETMIRLPRDTVVTGVERFQVTYRHLDELAEAETYAVIGEPQRGPVLLTLRCKRLTGGSTA